MKTQSGLQRFRFLPLFIVLVMVLAVPASVHAASCSTGRCPTGEYDEDDREVEITLTFTISPEEAGTIEVDGDLLEGSSFETCQGTEVTLEAVPESGWEFESWSGSMSSDDNPWTTPFYNHKYLTANFTRSSTTDEEDADDGVESGVSVEIDEDTVAVDADGDPFDEIEVDVRSAHDAPSDRVLVGNAYDLGPDGAEFDPPVPLTITYESGELPDGVDAGELVIAWLDEEADEWVELESSVDEDAREVVAEVSHFTEFCLMAPRPVEAAVAAPLSAPGFSFSGLAIATADAQVGQPIDVVVTASYNGEQPSASSQVQLLLDGEIASATEVSLDSGESTQVTLSVVAENDGTHAIEVNGLQASVEVWPASAPTALSDAVALAEEDTFDAPAFSLPKLPSLPGLPSLSLPSLSLPSMSLPRGWPIGVIIGAAVVLLLVLLPLLRRRILRYRYDI